MIMTETMQSGFETFVQRVDPSARETDVRLFRQQIDRLHAIALELILESARYEHGPAGFPDRTGTVALFVGPRGAGKTTAAKMLARELGTQLARVKLLDVMSKYIGETERNLEAVLSTATNTGSILLFDEADALFGKRTEVKDGHDRYADIQADWLDRRIKAYPGFVILGCAELPEHWERMEHVVHFGPAAQ